MKEHLLPGVYEVKAALNGFKTAIVPQVVVAVDTQTPVDFTLEVGGLTETIEVNGGSPLLKLDRADVATRFDAKELTALPVLDRNFTRFTLLTPGTQQLPWQHASSENPQGSTQTMVNGQHFGGTGFQLDGTDNRDPVLGIIVINPNLEAIAETKVTSQNYDAEFGQATAGMVSVLTRSGTNALAGSAFEFYRGDRFLGWRTQARNPFTQPAAVPLPRTRRHQFGGALGGPIKTNSWFFFGDYQGTRSSEGGSRRVTVPTAAARGGDLSEYGIDVYDPLTGRRFPGGVIPAERLSPQALALLRFIPPPNLEGIRDNYVVGGSERFDGDTADLRLDGRIGERLGLFGRYSVAHYVRDGPSAFGAGGGVELVSLGGSSNSTNQSLALGVDHRFDSTTVWDTRFGFFRYKVDVKRSDFGATPARDAGIPGLNLDLYSSGLPRGTVEGPEGGFEFGPFCNCPLVQDEKQFQIVSNLTKQLGNHTVKIGIDVRRALNLRVPSDRHRSGFLGFRPDRTADPQLGGGLGLATFLLGDVSDFSRYVSTTTDARERQWRHFYYAQDTWRMLPRLTLGYGLRLDVIDPQTVNAPGNGGWLDLGTGEILVGGVGDVNLAGNVANSLNFAPRIGLTYQLSERTVIRMGYGRTYDIGVFGSTFGHSVTQNLPVLSVQELTAPTFERVFDLAAGPPPPTFVPVPSSGRFRLPDGVFTQALPRKMRLPTVDAYNVAIQRQITPALTLDLAYVGNKGTHVFAGDGSGDNVNEPILAGFPDVPRAQRTPFFNGPIASLGGPFGWEQGIDYFCNCADDRYDSLQVRLARRFADGYGFLTHYTLQRTRQDGDLQFFYDRELERGRPEWDRIHNFALAAMAELPFGRGRRFLTRPGRLAGLLLGGWQVNVAAIVQSGLPLAVTYREAFEDRDVGSNRPDLIGDPAVGSGDGRRAPYFNVTPIGSPGSAFGRPRKGTFGSLRRNTFDGPGYWRVDASLFKRLAVGSDRALEVRLEAVNVFNHVNLGNPDAEIGVPGNDNPNAGFVNSTAYFGNDPQRILQFGLRLTF